MSRILDASQDILADGSADISPAEAVEIIEADRRSRRESG
jgi:hypothetical protein